MRASLRRRLLVTLLAAIAPVVLILAVLLFQTVRTSVWHSFDTDLGDLTTALAELLEYDDDGYEFELGEDPDPLTRSEGQVTYLELRDPDGELISRTPGLGDALDVVDMASVNEDEVTLRTIDLPDGRRLRLAILRFEPEMEEDAAPGTPPPGVSTVVLARETAGTRAMLAAIGYWFVALGFVTLGAASFAAWLAVRRGLLPVQQVAQGLAAIDERDLSTRLDTSAVPEELDPIVRHTNALLDRLQKSFERERRFTSDVAHELRTPLSVLRTSIELALRRPRPAEEAQEVLREDLEVVEQLSSMIDNLLTLARLDGPGVEPDRRPFRLEPLVREVWSMYAAQAHGRELEFRCEVAPDATVDSDRELLRIVLSNLLSNAAAYTQRGGWVAVRSAPEQGLLLSVVDSGPPIPAEDREHLFERMWRADEARSDAGVHCGIGLSLVRSISRQLGCAVTVAEDASGGPSFEVHRSDA